MSAESGIRRELDRLGRKEYTVSALAFPMQGFHILVKTLQKPTDAEIRETMLSLEGMTAGDRPNAFVYRQPGADGVGPKLDVAFVRMERL